MARKYSRNSKGQFAPKKRGGGKRKGSKARGKRVRSSRAAKSRGARKNVRHTRKGTHTFVPKHR